jgi:hypothetical protein
VLVLQRCLNLEKLAHYFVNVNSLCLQLSMCNLIAKSIIPHNLGPRASSPRALIKYESRSILKSQARQPLVIWIVQIPSPANRPIPARSPLSNGSTAFIIDRSLQLASTQYEVGLVIYPLLQLDPVYRVFISVRPSSRTLRFKLGIDFAINCLDKWQIAHVSEHRSKRLSS